MADSPESNFVISVKLVALVSVILAMAALTTLVVVTSVDDVDVLSTVALALAILAFVVQLIVFIVQSSQSSQQLLHSRELYNSTQQLLTQIQERTRGTETVVTRMNDQLLTHVLGKAITQTASEEGGSSGEDYTNRLAENVNRILEHNRDLPSRVDTSEQDRKDAEVLELLATFPSEPELSRSIETLRSLDVEDVRHLARLLRDDRTYRGPGVQLAPGIIYEGNMQSLLDRGLAELRFERPDIIRLTDAGRAVGRLLSAQDSPPSSLPPWLNTMREYHYADVRPTRPSYPRRIEETSPDSGPRTVG